MFATRIPALSPAFVGCVRNALIREWIALQVLCIGVSGVPSINSSCMRLANFRCFRH